MADHRLFMAPSEHLEEERFESYANDLGDSPDTQTLLELSDKLNVRFLRLVFFDIHGTPKNIELPRSQFKKAFDGEIMFDGSSIAGYVKIEESDMLLVPDLTTFRVYPGGNPEARMAHLYCWVRRPLTGERFDGDPRGCLKRQDDKAGEMGFEMVTGVEAEFFLFALGEDGLPEVNFSDHAAYFDVPPTDRASVARREMMTTLEALGMEVEAGHHEVAESQHEINFRFGPCVQTADNLATFKFVVKNIALKHGLHATFMPKPLFGANGSGMHTHQSLMQDGENIFHDPSAPLELSQTMLYYIGGLMEHAGAITAITNPIVNSYKRLVPGYEAPVNIAWSQRNRSVMVRVPDQRGMGTRLEARIPDPSCNVYLSLAVQLAAGLDGIKTRRDPGEAMDINVWKLTAGAREALGVGTLPGNLGEAINALSASPVITDALGSHITDNFLSIKREEWREYIAFVSRWEVDRYLEV